VDRRGTSAGKGNSLGDSPSPYWDLAPSAKVIRGGLSAPSPGRGQGATSYNWWVPGPPVQTPLLDITVEELQVTVIVEKPKVIFFLDSGACFSVLPFSPGLQSNNKVIIWGISGQPLECYFTWPLS
jgi:hypothetical protein